MEDGRLNLTGLIPGKFYSCHLSQLAEDGTMANWAGKVKFRTSGRWDRHVRLVPHDTYVILALASGTSIVLNPAFNVSVVIASYVDNFSRTVPASAAMTEGITGLKPAHRYRVRLVLQQREGFCSTAGCQEDEGPWQDVVTEYNVDSVLRPTLVPICVLAVAAIAGMIAAAVRQRRKIDALERSLRIKRKFVPEAKMLSVV